MGERRRGRPRHPDVLTPAEWRVLDYARHGLSIRRIAAARETSTDAVKFHLENIGAKLELHGLAELRHWPGVPAGSPISIRREEAMPTSYQLGPIGQVALTVDDIEAAVTFYRDTLGLPHLYTFGNLAFFDMAGTRLFITAASDAEHSRNHSVIYFRVPDIQGGYEALKARGVAFTGAPHMIHRHDDGTEEWMAFFSDPAGNTLAIMSQARA